MDKWISSKMYMNGYTVKNRCVDRLTDIYLEKLIDIFIQIDRWM